MMYTMMTGIKSATASPVLGHPNVHVLTLEGDSGHISIHLHGPTGPVIAKAMADAWRTAVTPVVEITQPAPQEAPALGVAAE